jgi:hypothetical protein
MHQAEHLIAAALLVASLVGFLIFVLFEVVLLAVVFAIRLVNLAFAYALLVGFVFRIILILERSRDRLHHASTDTKPHDYRRNPDTTL